jgi:hypothetical protein
MSSHLRPVHQPTKQSTKMLLKNTLLSAGAVLLAGAAANAQSSTASGSQSAGPSSQGTCTLAAVRAPHLSLASSTPSDAADQPLVMTGCPPDGCLALQQRRLLLVDRHRLLMSRRLGRGRRRDWTSRSDVRVSSRYVVLVRWPLRVTIGTEPQHRAPTQTTLTAPTRPALRAPASLKACARFIISWAAQLLPKLTPRDRLS